MNKIYCFDLDNTICKTESLNYECSVPYFDRIKIINDLFEQKNTIIIDTARGNVTGIDWYELTKKQLDEWGLKYHTLRCGVKFNADYYVDDKSITDKNFFGVLDE